MKIKSLGVRRNVLVLAVATTALVVSGGVAVARGGDNAGRDKAALAAPASVKTSGGVCKAGFATSDEVLKPPDDTAEDNTAAGTVVLTKKCSGAASITFSSETLTTGAGDFINLAFRATCTGSGGYKHHCKVGNTKTASPGETYFQHNVFPQLQVQSVTEVFSGLRRGKWKFEVLPGGNNHAILVFRTTMVQAYSGG